jgi:hypothetical protein
MKLTKQLHYDLERCLYIPLHNELSARSYFPFRHQMEHKQWSVLSGGALVSQLISKVGTQSK